MKTPMQEHLEWLKNEYELILKLGGENQRLLIEDCIKHAESMLEKEKEVIMDAYNYGQQIPPFDYAERYYDETFNIEEK